MSVSKRFWMLWAAVLLLIGISFAAPIPALAQTEQTTAVKALEPFLEQARKSGATVIVVGPKAETKESKIEEAAENFDIGTLLDRAQFRFRLVLQGAGKFLHNALRAGKAH